MIEHQRESRGPARDALVHERDLVAIPDRRSDRVLRDRGKLARLRGDALDREETRKIRGVLGERPVLDMHGHGRDDRGGARVCLVESGRVDGGIRSANTERDLAVAERVG